GDILQVALTWQTTTPLPQNYTVFIQLLDTAGHLVGQRDAQPLTPTTTWSPDQAIADAHGLFIEPGTPPGRHRLIVGLYDSQTGQRLPLVSDEDEAPQDFVELAQIEIEKPARPLPVEAFAIQHPLNVAMLEVDLLGYDFYRAGHRSTPDTALRPGDPVQLIIYWRVHQPVYWLDDQLFIQVVGWGGRTSYQSLTRTPAGVDYDVSQWQPGEIVRAQHNFFLGDLEPGRYYLTFTVTNRVGGQRIVALSNPFWVE
ncbi:MAG: hypothetical protein R3264_08910, partial [Anaerolineae bacterium]|nr:hypothetical protein [Anaerolineae bacterium]